MKTYPQIKVSLCTWVHGRLHQLSKVFSTNADRVAGQPNLEWIIVCTKHCPHDCYGWLLGELPRIGVRVVQVKSDLHFCKMKNTSHGLATGEVLFNLDADNWIGPGFYDRVCKDYAKNPDGFFHYWDGRWSGGTCGRMGLSSANFRELGGYDEQMPGKVGYDDMDLKERAMVKGMQYILCKDPDVVGGSIPNTTGDTAKYTGNTFNDSHGKNIIYSTTRTLKGIWKANV